MTPCLWAPLRQAVCSMLKKTHLELTQPWHSHYSPGPLSWTSQWNQQQPSCACTPTPSCSLPEHSRNCKRGALKNSLKRDKQTIQNHFVLFKFIPQRLFFSSKRKFSPLSISELRLFLGFILRVLDHEMLPALPFGISLQWSQFSASSQSQSSTGNSDELRGSAAQHR